MARLIVIYDRDDKIIIQADRHQRPLFATLAVDDALPAAAIAGAASRLGMLLLEQLAPPVMDREFEEVEPRRIAPTITINELRDIAIRSGIVILDYETVETLRSRRLSEGTFDMNAVPDAKLIGVMHRFENFYREDLPLLTEYDDACEKIDKAFWNALMDEGVVPDDRTDTE